jgi:hypothetical protein
MQYYRVKLDDDSGQTINCANGPYLAEAPFYLSGTQQITSADFCMVTATTSAGMTTTLSGHFK